MVKILYTNKHNCTVHTTQKIYLVNQTDKASWEGQMSACMLTKVLYTKVKLPKSQKFNLLFSDLFLSKPTWMCCYKSSKFNKIG